MPTTEEAARDAERRRQWTAASLRFHALGEDRLQRRVAHARIDEPGAWREFEEPARVAQRLALQGRDGVYEQLEQDDVPSRAAPLASIISSPTDSGIVGGANQMISSYFLVRGERARRTVARLLRPDGFAIGSGFLVGPGLLMTNFHVLPDAGYAGSSHIEFDYVHTPRGELPRCRHELAPGRFFYANRDLDYALVAVDPHIGAGRGLEDRGWNPLIEASGKALVHERVNIIQHPQGRPQEIALRDNKIVGYKGNFIHYLADTQSGSSGSPVWNDEWDLVALHHASIGPTDKGGAVIARDGGTWNARNEDDVEWVANEGVRISRIAASLRVAEAAWPQAQRDLLASCFKSPPEDELERPVRPRTTSTKLEEDLASWGRLDEAARGHRVDS